MIGVTIQHSVNISNMMEKKRSCIKQIKKMCFFYCKDDEFDRKKLYSDISQVISQVSLPKFQNSEINVGVTDGHVMVFLGNEDEIMGKISELKVTKLSETMMIKMISKRLRKMRKISSQKLKYSDIVEKFKKVDCTGTSTEVKKLIESCKDILYREDMTEGIMRKAWEIYEIDGIMNS